MRGRIANTEVNKSRPCDRDGALSSEGAVCEGLLGGNRGLSVQVKSRGSEKGRRQMEIYRESRRKAGGERKKRKRKRKWIKKGEGREIQDEEHKKGWSPFNAFLVLYFLHLFPARKK